MVGVSLDLDRLRQVDAAKDDAGVGRGRAQSHKDFFAGMESDTGGTDDIFQRALPDHELTL